MADEVNQHPLPLEESSSQERLHEIEVPSSSATDLDRPRETCSFPLGIWMRIPGNGKTVLFASDGKGLGSESGWLYFKARPGKNILKGPPNNVKGWKKRFFFISRDDWEFHLSIPHKGGVVRVPMSWGTPGKRCNKVPALSETEDEIFHRVFEKIGEGGHFKIPVVLDSRTFHKYFAEMSSSGGNSTAEGDIGGKAEGDIGGRAVASAGNTRIIGKEMTRILPHVPDLTLLRWLGGKVRDPSLGPAPNNSSSSFDFRIKLSHLTKVVAEKNATSSSKGVMIFEASETASKKRALDDGSKGKQVAPLSEAKKIKACSGTHMVLAWPPIPGEGSATKSVPGEAIGPHASVMSSTATAEKLLVRVILPTDKEKVEKFTFDQGALTKVSAKGKKDAEEVEAKNKEVERLEARVTKLEKSQNLAKGRIIAAFKESDDFQEAVIGSVSSYFGDGFNFCKRQLAHHYPNLSIDLEDIEMDCDFLAKEEAKVEEREGKAAEERGEKETEVEEGGLGDES
ncbi:hypothetical protein Acr_01g0006830 [Actinidia rufa]|uniref:Uncharacterized protein n=1 Tax=Actinidia rufa TaxID=165716 RepID=A0A7J0E305_9ERIC|nr:hypothetical protein Acr_01g0006830 [Actinidia rufa]